MYEVEKVVGGHQVWHREENRPVDDQYIYPSRQNAYVRRDQLNGMSRGKVFTVHIRLHCRDCQDAIKALRQAFGDLIEFFVIDPLNNHAPDVRDVYFRYRCASPLQAAQVVRHRFSKHYPPLPEMEFAAKLEEVTKRLPLVQSPSVSPLEETNNHNHL